LWHLRETGLSAAPTAILADHETEIKSVCMTADGRGAASGADDGSVIVWDLRQKASVRQIACGHSSVTDLQYTAGDQELIAVNSAGAVHRFDWSRFSSIHDF
jgi:WD40 repeat protein